MAFETASRPSAHRTGDLGITAVRRFFLEADWVVNDIHSDYGEDLMLQPTASGQIEKFRVFAQVKSIGATSHRRSVRLRTGDLFLWQFLRDPFLLLVWHERTNELFVRWMNQSRDPKLFVESKGREISLTTMELLDKSYVNFLRSELRNIEYHSTLKELSDFIEANGGYQSEHPEVADAKLAAVHIALRMLSQDGILYHDKKDNWSVNVDYLIENLHLIVDYAYSRGNTRSRLLRIGSMSWALFVVSHAWHSLYANAPMDHLLWALGNVAEMTVTRNEVFLPLVRRIVRERVPK